ncbi:sensor histidine kinase [Sandarakinorhabdus sp. DWP1-3-1]|uniref:sensor histidine kinase n=1 Tax=Sandarakinorhabdus sp. DWP1-3-1 TaxID=2804627 RepID=UPI003CF7BB9F
MAPDEFAVIVPEVALTLVSAVIGSSTSPLILLDGELRVVLASTSFGRCFDLSPGDIIGHNIFALGHGEWDVPRLRSLLSATLSGAEITPAYEIDLDLPKRGRRRLVINASKLAYDGSPTRTRVLVAIADVTDARIATRANERLLQEKAVLVREIQHRVANSLQIIASVLMQSARKVGSEDARVHLKDAHSRVLAIAELQRKLAESENDEVHIGPYLKQLCQSLGASMIDDHDRISLTSTADDSLVPANISVSIGLVVTELVINSLKHAFPDKRQGKVTVAYCAAGNAWTLTVTDDGIGMDGEADTSPGLGTSIVTALARHLNAEIAVSDGAPGTIVTVTHAEGAEAVADEEPV